MYYELALISVTIAAGYWGLYFVRGELTRTYGAMQLGSAACAGLGLLARKTDGPAVLGVVGAIGVGAGTCLLVVGPLIRALARRAAAAERFRIADKLLDIADVLAPGSGISDEKALLGAMREIRDGNIEQTVEALTAAKHAAPADARLAIDERIAMLYLAAYRWDEAIAHAEENLFGATPPEGNAQIGALRRVLGVAPPVWVELLGAYGYKGDLDQAARMLARLEDACAGRDDAAIWVHRGRMIFLALAGRVAAVEQLVEPRRSRHMSRAARTYWVAVAHERKGDGPAAAAAYTKARARSRGRPRVLIDRALERLPGIRQIELGPAAAELVKQVEAAPPPDVTLPARPSPPRATRLLAGGVLAAAAAIAIVLGESSDIGVLMRAGALMRGLVNNGEWWRFVSAVFVHLTGLHLLVNVICLWFLGRVCEDLFGSARTIALFALAGIAGEVTSYVASPLPMVSAGVSGAVLGLLGAVFAELTWQRRRHRTSSASRALWTSLAIVALGQIGIDFVYTGVTDQWAHGGGLATGFIAGLALSPHARWASASKWFARVVAVVFGIACVVAAVMVVRTPLAESLGTPSQQLAQKGVALTVPAGWRLAKDGVIQDADNIIDVEIDTFDGDTKPGLEAWTHEQQKRAHDLGFDQIDLATEHVVALPPGWEGSELAVSFSSADPITGRQRYRVVVAARRFEGQLDGKLVLASVYIPETLARGEAPFFTALLASATPAK